MSISLSLRSAMLAASHSTAQLDQNTLAAHAAGQAQHVTLRTRMRHRDLLATALRTLHGQVTELPDAVIAEWAGRRVRFDYAADGVQLAHVDGAALTPQDAESLVLAVDDAYAVEVQRQVCARLKERAAAAGMRVEAEQTNPDASVTVTLAAM